MSLLRLPRRIEIPPLIYTVRLCTPPKEISAEREGECEFLKNEIRLNRSCAPDRLRSVLWHEVLHAIWESASLPHSFSKQEGFPGLSVRVAHLDELIVEALTGRTLDVLRRNPKLLRFLCQRGRL